MGIGCDSDYSMELQLRLRQLMVAELDANGDDPERDVGLEIGHHYLNSRVLGYNS